jgi:hypothetical protein
LIENAFLQIIPRILLLELANHSHGSLLAFLSWNWFKRTNLFLLNPCFLHAYLQVLLKYLKEYNEYVVRLYCDHMQGSVPACVPSK